MIYPASRLYIPIQLFDIKRNFPFYPCQSTPSSSRSSILLPHASSHSIVFTSIIFISIRLPIVFSSINPFSFSLSFFLFPPSTFLCTVSYFLSQFFFWSLPQYFLPFYWVHIMSPLFSITCFFIIHTYVKAISGLFKKYAATTEAWSVGPWSASCPA
jgi:hypothetical protein